MSRLIKLLITSAKGFFHHYQAHQGPHSILKQCDRGTQSDRTELQHVLAESMHPRSKELNLAVIGLQTTD